MRAIVTEGKLKDLLDEIVINNFGRGVKDTHERPWHIVFSEGYYGKYYTALCELEGSPVKARVIIDISDLRDCFLTKNISICHPSVTAISACMHKTKKFTPGNSNQSRTKQILYEVASLRDKLLEEKQNNKQSR